MMTLFGKFLIVLVVIVGVFIVGVGIIISCKELRKYNIEIFFEFNFMDFLLICWFLFNYMIRKVGLIWLYYNYLF